MRRAQRSLETLQHFLCSNRSRWCGVGAAEAPTQPLDPSSNLHWDDSLPPSLSSSLPGGGWHPYGPGPRPSCPCFIPLAFLLVTGQVGVEAADTKGSPTGTNLTWWHVLSFIVVKIVHIFSPVPGERPCCQGPTASAVCRPLPAWPQRGFSREGGGAHCSLHRSPWDSPFASWLNVVYVFTRVKQPQTS